MAKPPHATPVTRPDLPPLNEFTALLEQLWDSQVLTNHGPFVQRLEAELAALFGVPFVAAVSHGTLGLLLACRALDLSGEVITTPFTFPATANALRWAGLTPVFVDVEPDTLTLDPACIEAAITPRTSAIVPVHTYGIPCDGDAIDAVAARHGLRVIYDAAPAFGVECHCGSVLAHGDLSVLSFHATKPFHTIEGGAVISHDPEVHARLGRLRNFGYSPTGELLDEGINAKLNELQAALGLLQLPRFEAARVERARLTALWHAGLARIPGLTPLDPTVRARRPNYAYLPVRVDDEYPLSRDALWAWLRTQGVEPRRYYQPLVSGGGAAAPIAADAAQRMLCLPLFVGLEDAEIERILALLAAPEGA